MSHIIGKLSMKATTFFKTSLQLEVCIRNYGRAKWWEAWFENFGTPWDFWERCHLDVALMTNHKDYYKEGGRWWLPLSSSCDELYEFVYVRGSSVHQKCFNYALINLLYGLCRSIWIVCLSIVLIPILKFQHILFTPLEVLWAREHTSIPCIFVVFILEFAFESFKKFEDVSRWKNICANKNINSCN
jgi:hypothetical protein